jgi:thiol-disulfide isomerase/thioredoxin
LALSKYRGKVLVLDFWATWCGACFQPVEDLQELARSHPEWKDSVVLLTISVDTERKRVSEVIQKKKWIHTTNLSTSPVALDSLGIKVLPTTIVVAQDGTVAMMGGSHAIDVEKEVDKLLLLKDE